MAGERKRYRFGSFSWFLLAAALVGVYFLFYDDITVFFVVSGICIFIAGLLWFLARRGVSSRTKVMYDNLNSYYGNVQKRYKSDQQLVHLKNNDPTVSFCENCGFRMETDSTFCSSCGKEV